MVYELDWWQNRECSVQDFGSSRHTFVGSKNESLEAIIEFKKGRKDRGVEDLDESLGGECGRAGTLDIGGSLAVEVDVRMLLYQVKSFKCDIWSLISLHIGAGQRS